MSIDPTSAAAEQVLEALAVHDLDPADPRVVARFVAEPELAVRWRSMAATIAELVDLGASAAAIEAAAGVPHLDTMAAIRAFRGEAPPGNRRRFFVLTVAAVAAVAVLLLWSPWAGREEPIDPRLGGTGMVLTPNGTAWPEGSPLLWTAVRGAQYYRLEIQPVPEGALLTIPSEASAQGMLTATQWLPSPPERSRLPQRFQWRVNAFDASDRVLATSGSAETWR
ncbi:MAG TPA: hypothetical protein VFD82_08580 [Planctomycetota bacterium]|nr:hypothetical protein [Planctomycetota bacterium]